MLSPDKGKSSCKGNYQMKCFLNIPIDRCPLCSVLCRSKSAVLLCATNTARTHARIHISNSVARIRQLFKVTLRKHCALLHLINLLRQFLAYLKKIFNMSFHVQLVTVFVQILQKEHITFYSLHVVVTGGLWMWHLTLSRVRFGGYLAFQAVSKKSNHETRFAHVFFLADNSFRRWHGD